MWETVDSTRTVAQKRYKWDYEKRARRPPVFKTNKSAFVDRPPVAVGASNLDRTNKTTYNQSVQRVDRPFHFICARHYTLNIDKNGVCNTISTDPASLRSCVNTNASRLDEYNTTKSEVGTIENEFQVTEGDLKMQLSKTKTTIREPRSGLKCNDGIWADQYHAEISPMMVRLIQEYTLYNESLETRKKWKNASNRTMVPLFVQRWHGKTTRQLRRPRFV